MSRILIIDDDAVQLDLYKQLLEIAGYSVGIALNERQTVRQVNGEATDLIVMDLRLANATGEADAEAGLALIRRLRDLGWAIPVIVLSGWPDDLYGQPEEQLVSRILMKPVKTRELLHAISDVLA